MARTKGMVPVNSNYEVSVKKPLDARSTVPSYADLIDKNNWLSSKGSPICYNGMLVAVINTSDISNNGLYMLFDVKATTALKTPDVTVEANWIKIGETSDISSIAERLTTIESKVGAIEASLENLDARVKTLEETQPEDEILTYAYRSSFPVEGEVGKLYIAADKQCSYIWDETQQGYVVVGSGLYEDLEVDTIVIDGGSAV